jgi:hypothetical protein
VCGERADADEAHGQAHLRHLHVGRAQQVARPLDASREQILVRRFAERLPEAAG